jgi:hypothetical protein
MAITQQDPNTGLVYDDAFDLWLTPDGERAFLPDGPELNPQQVREHLEHRGFQFEDEPQRPHVEYGSPEYEQAVVASQQTAAAQLEEYYAERDQWLKDSGAGHVDPTRFDEFVANAPGDVRDYDTALRNYNVEMNTHGSRNTLDSAIDDLFPRG